VAHFRDGFVAIGGFFSGEKTKKTKKKQARQKYSWSDLKKNRSDGKRRMKT